MMKVTKLTRTIYQIIIFVRDMIDREKVKGGRDEG
jgi:hypothetical protein